MLYFPTGRCNLNRDYMSKYYESQAISQSKLQELGKSPRHFWEKYLSSHCKFRQANEFSLSAAIHAYLLEPNKFGACYAVERKFDMSDPQDKLSAAKFIIDSAGKYILSHNDMQTILSIYYSVFRKSTAKMLLRNGLPEFELYWRDWQTHIACKAKLDYFIEPCKRFPNGLIVEIKTTTNASHAAFLKTIYSLGYYHQVAFYASGVRQVYRTHDYPIFIFIPVEIQQPHECSFLAANHQILHLGLQRNRQLLKKYKQCLESNVWDGYSDRIETLI
jgi:hypothetical protein